MHLSKLMPNSQLFDQSHALSRSSYKTLLLALFSSLDINFVSSAYNFEIIRKQSIRSFIKITKRNGPITEPYGAVLSTALYSEIFSFTVTLCTGLLKKDLIHFKNLTFIPYLLSFNKSSTMRIGIKSLCKIKIDHINRITI